MVVSTRKVELRRRKVLQKMYEKQKVSLQILKNAKGTGTNERTNTDTLHPYDLFSRRLRRSMK